MSDDPFERRQAERRYALNFLDYEILAAAGNVQGRGLARTLDISESGLRLETSQFFEPGQKLRLTIGLKNDMVQLVGQVVNCQPENDDLCRSGVLFLEFAVEQQELYQKHFLALRTALNH